MQNQGYRPTSSNGHPARSKWLVPAAGFVALVAVFVAVFSGSVFSGDDASYREYKQSQEVFLDHIYIDDIHLGGMSYNEAWDALMAHSQAWEKSWTLELACNDFVYATIDYPTAGIRLDYEQLEDLLQEAWSIGHEKGFEGYKAAAAQLSAEPFKAYTATTAGDGGHLDYILGVIADNVYRAPVDASMIEFDASNLQSPFVFQQGTDGWQLNAEKVRNDILHLAATGESGRYNIELDRIAPSVTVEMLEDSYALLSEAITAVDRHSTKERNENIALAYSFINGMTLENGDRFSFNKVVGKRSLINGFKNALGYVSGELVDVIGGGVCQASTTVYSAAVCAGMTITERTAHSVPVSYISLGQDATVNDMRGHEIDLKFTNETGGTIYITAGLETNASGRLQSAVRFFGQQLPEDQYYRLESVITEVLPIPEDVIRKDKDAKYVVYDDQTYKASEGAEGQVVETYLQLYQDGQLLQSERISKDTYKARAAVYYVGVTLREEP